MSAVQSLEELMTMYPDDASCVRELAARRWPDGFRCPACGGSRSTILRHGRLWHCSACDLQTAVTAGTVMFGSKTPIRTWFAAAHLLHTDPEVPVGTLAKQLGIGGTAASTMIDRIVAGTPQGLGARDRG
jgi:predicted RNA-binding Zn-ribbon protein involved in translation (DUF1610 family)